MTRPGFRVSVTVTILTAFALLFVLAMGAVVWGYRRTGARAAMETGALLACRATIDTYIGDAVMAIWNASQSDRLAYSAIGSMVNLASRLEGMNKAHRTRILISEATRRGIRGGGSPGRDRRNGG